jgi:uncharacterized membrane protein HdeD (DUF308 family)
MSDSTFLAGTLPTVRAHWGWFLVEGIVIVVLGALAIALPLFAGLAIAIVLGWLLIVAGIVGLFATMNARYAPGFAWALISAVLALVVGVVLLWDPAAGLVTLTLALIVYFAVDGILNIALAITHRRDYASGRWEWMLFNGIVDLILAAIVFAGLPGTVTWVLGLLVGIDLVVGGAALIAMALAAKRALP